jgi:hypothetical protein
MAIPTSKSEFSESGGIVRNVESWRKVCAINVEKVWHQHVRILGGLSTGKSLFLFRLIRLYEECRTPLAIIDCATEEGGDSLLNTLRRDMLISNSTRRKIFESPQSRYIKSDKELVEVLMSSDIERRIDDWYPELRLDSYATFGFDVSSYLEQGHRASCQGVKQKYRDLYKSLSNQILLKVLCLSQSRSLAIVTDEIEFSPITKRILARFSKSPFCLISAVHNYGFLSDSVDFFSYEVNLNRSIDVFRVPGNALRGD